MAVPVIRATILISSESEDEPEIIAVSPQTRNAIVSRTAFAPPSSSLLNINSIPSTTKKLRSDYIDNIVETITTKLPKSACNKKRKRKKRNPLNEVLKTQPSNLILTPRNEMKCFKLGLRKQIKSLELFQAGVEEPSNKKEKRSLNDDQVEIDSAEENDDEIQYLLSSNTTNSIVEEDKETEPHLVKFIKEAIPSPSNGFPVAENNFEEITNTVKAKPEWKDNIKTTYNENDVYDYVEQKHEAYKQVRSGELNINDVCLTCGTTKEVVCEHPLFQGGLCKEHRTMFKVWYFECDADGCQSYCSVCCMGMRVVVCDNTDCDRCFCTTCLNILVYPGYYDEVASLENWKCFLCTDNHNGSDGLIIKRDDWQDKLRTLHLESKNQYPVAIPMPISEDERKPIRVLSLFDGIGTGLVALKQLGLQIGVFVASEIDEAAIRLVQNRHPEVIHVGDVTKFSDDDVRRLGPFDLLIGGSPCNDLSGANPRRKGLLDSDGTGCLFFDFYRILRAAEPPRCECNAGKSRPFFWLFENVLSMKLLERRRISRFLQCQPVKANASTVSAAARPRLFWGNLPGLQTLELKPQPGDRLSVQSCLEPGRTATIEKLNTITTKPGCLYQGHTRIAPVTHMGKEDILWSTELERIFGLPKHYTDLNNHGPKERLALLGRSWSVPVVQQILAPLKEYFASEK